MALCEEAYQLYVLHICTQYSLSTIMPISPMVSGDTAYTVFPRSKMRNATGRQNYLRSLRTTQYTYMSSITKVLAPCQNALEAQASTMARSPVRISQHAVAGSDDLPDVSTRDANTHELNAMPTHMWRIQNTLAGSGVKGREQEPSVRARGFSANLIINLVETIMIDHARSCRRSLCSPR